MLKVIPVPDGTDNPGPEDPPGAGKSGESPKKIIIIDIRTLFLFIVYSVWLTLPLAIPAVEFDHTSIL